MNKQLLTRWLLLVVLAMVPFTAFVSAESPDTRTRAYHELDSRLMARKMPYEVIKPVGYDSNKKKYPAIFLLHGLTGKYSDWLEKSKLIEHAKAYQLVLIMPEGNNGWYSDSPVDKNAKYESYIIEELIPEVERLYRVNTGRESRAIAGLSMGGYGALKFGLRFPSKFVLAGSFSGALRAVEWDEKTFPAFKVLGDSVNSAFGKKGNGARDRNDIFKILGSKTEEQVKNLPFVYLDCGTEDGLIVQNRAFTDLLMRKKIPHEFRQLPGKHDWKYWDLQIQEFLELTKRFLK